MRISDETRDRLSVRFVVLFPHLDERQRRLLLGAETRGARRCPGRRTGGRVCETTVCKGVFELEAGEGPLGRVRHPGGKRVAELDLGCGQLYRRWLWRVSAASR